MAFLEQRISDRITAATSFEIEHPSRLKTYAQGGRLSQQFGNSPPRHKVNLANGVKTQAQFQSLVDAFYIVLFTPYVGLRVKNWQDYQATKTNSQLTQHAASPTEWQLQRKHSFGGITFLRDITKPCTTPAPVIYRTRSAVETVATASIDYTSGIAAISGHVAGDTYTWVGEFDLPMTFSENVWRAQLDGTANRLYVKDSLIPMEEVLGATG